jgi:hypothetical protein
MLSCPSCGSPDIHYSRIRSKLEQLRKNLTKQTVHRCHQCTWRGFGEDTGPKFAPEEIARATSAVCDRQLADEWPHSVGDFSSAAREQME